MKLLERLKKEVCFYYNLQARHLQIKDYEELIDGQEFFKLRLVFKFRRLPNYLWLKLLDCGDAKTILAYLQRYDYPSQVSMVMKLSDERIKELKLNTWIEGKLQSIGLVKKNYIFLADHASSFLYRAMLFLRKSVVQLNQYLETSYRSQYVLCPADLWSDLVENFQMIMFEKDMFLLKSEEAILLIDKMLLENDEAEELIKLDSKDIIDAWLSANILREKVIQRLDKQGFAFEARPYLSDENKQLLLQNGWNLKDYHLD